MRRGVVTAFRASAEVDVAPSAGFRGSCAKRSGRGVLVDFIVRIDVMDDVREIRGRIVRVDDGRRKEGGSSPQLMGGFGGITTSKVAFVVY